MAGADDASSETPRKVRAAEKVNSERSAPIGAALLFCSAVGFGGLFATPRAAMASDASPTATVASAVISADIGAPVASNVVAIEPLRAHTKKVVAEASTIKTEESASPAPVKTESSYAAAVGESAVAPVEPTDIFKEGEFTDKTMPMAVAEPITVAAVVPVAPVAAAEPAVAAMVPSAQAVEPPTVAAPAVSSPANSEPAVVAAAPATVTAQTTVVSQEVFPVSPQQQGQQPVQQLPPAREGAEGAVHTTKGILFFFMNMVMGFYGFTVFRQLRENALWKMAQERKAMKEKRQQRDGGIDGSGGFSKKEAVDYLEGIYKLSDNK